MSNVVDSKVVEMKFDNSDFERNVNTSMSTLDKLKSKLDFKDTTSGIGNLAEAIKSVSFDSMNNAVGSVSIKFSALQSIAVGALSKIGSAAIDATARVAKSVTGIAAATAGWQKYEEETTSVQTIMAATGRSIEDVQEKLDLLMLYTDETSYAYTDMVSNIGKFTSQGIDLEEATVAMMGISNWAALSGQNAASASRAMYNLSQALGMGSVRVQDWMSIENANMATEGFKKTVIDTALELGVLTEAADGVIKTNSGVEVSVATFRNTLSEGWFTSDVLINALYDYGYASSMLISYCDEYGVTVTDFLQEMDRFSEGGYLIDDMAANLGVDVKELSGVVNKLTSESAELSLQSFRAAQEAKTLTDAIDATKDAAGSAWKTTWQNLFGNYEEAKVLWTNLANYMYDIFVEPQNEINELLAGWKENRGYELWAAALDNVMSSLTDTIAAVKEAFFEVFPRSTVSDLVSLTRRFKLFTDGLLMTEDRLDSVKTIVRAFLSPFSTLKSLIGDVVSLFKDAAKDVFTSSFTSVIGKVSEVIVNISAAIESFFSKIKLSDSAKNSIKSFFTSVMSSAKKVASVLSSLFGSEEKAADGLSSGVNRFLELSARVLESIGKIVVGFVDLVVDSGLLSTAIDTIVSIFDFLANSIGNAVSAVSEFLSESSLIQNGVSSIKRGISSACEFITEIISPSIDDCSDSISDASDAFRDFSDTSSKCSDVDSEWVGDLTEKTSDSSESATTASKSYSIFGQVIKTVGLAVSKVIEVLKSIPRLFSPDSPSGSVLVSTFSIIKNVIIGIASSLKFIYDAIYGLFTGNFGALDSDLEKAEDKFEGAGTAANVLLTVIRAVVDFVKESSPKIQEAINTAFGFVFENGFSLSGVIQGIANAIGYLVDIVNASNIIGVIKSIVGIKLSNALTELLNGISNVTYVINSVKASFRGLSYYLKGAALKAVAAAILEFAAALFILYIDLALYSTLDWNSALRGLAYMALVTAEVVAALSVMPKSGTLKATGVLVLATAMLEMYAVIRLFGATDANKLAKGVAAILAVLAGLSISLNIMSKSGLLSKAVVMISLAASMLVLYAAVKMFSKMDSGDIAKGIIGLIAVLTLVEVFVVTMNTIGGANIGALASVSIISGSLLVLAADMALFSRFSWESIIRSCVAMGLSLLEIVVAMELISAVSSGGGLIRGAIAVGIISVSLLALFSTMQLYSSISVSNAADAAMSMAVGIVAICAALKFASGGGNFANAVAIGIIAVSLRVLYGVIVLFNGLGAGTITSSIAIISLVIAELASAIALSSKITGGTKALTSVLLMVAILGSIVAAVVVLNLFSPEKSLKSLEGIGAVLVGLSAVSLVMSKMKVSDSAKLAAKIAILIGSITVITGLIGALALIPGVSDALTSGQGVMNQLSEAMPAFISIVSGLALLCYTISGFNLSVGGSNLNIGGLGDVGQIAQLAADMAILVGGLTAIVGVLGAISSIPHVSDWLSAGSSVITLLADIVPSFSLVTETLLLLAKTVGGFCVSFGSMSFSAGGLTASAALEVGASIDILIALVTVLVAGLGALSDALGENGEGQSRLLYWLDTGGDILVSLADTVARVVGVICNIGLIGTIDALGEGLKLFMEDVADGVSSFSSIDDATFDNISKAGTALLALTGAELISGIAAFINLIPGLVSSASGGPFSALGREMKNLAEGFVDFGSVISEANEMGTINADDMDVYIEIISALAQMIKAMPRSGGVVDLVAGSKDLGEFGESLGEFIDPFLDFVAKVQEADIDQSKLDTATQVAKSIMEMASNVPNTGGAWAEFWGDNDIGEFGQKLVAWGASFVTYCATLDTFQINEDKIDMATRVANSIMDMADEAPNSGGVVGWFMGDNDIDTFGSKLVSWGNSFVAYCDAIKDIDPSDVARSSMVVSQGAILMSIAKGYESYNNNLDTLGSQIYDFVEYYVDCLDYIENTDIDTMNLIVDSVANLVSSLQNAKINGSSLLEFMDTLGSLATSFEGLDQESLNNLENVAVSILYNLAEYMLDHEDLIEIASSHMLDVASWGLQDESSLETLSSAAYNVGEYIAQGMANGISENSDIVIDAVSNMCNEMLTTSNDILGIASPSTEFYEDGAFCAEGEANGISDNAYLAVDAASEMSSAVADVAFSESTSGSAGSTMYSAGAELVDKASDGIDDSTAKAESAAETAVDSTAKAAENESTSPTVTASSTSAGSNLATEICDGVSSMIPSAESVSGYLVDSASNSALSESLSSGVISTNNSAGGNIAAELTDGIVENMSYAQAAGAGLSEAASYGTVQGSIDPLTLSNIQAAAYNISQAFVSYIDSYMGQIGGIDSASDWTAAMGQFSMSLDATSSSFLHAMSTYSGTAPTFVEVPTVTTNFIYSNSSSLDNYSDYADWFEREYGLSGSDTKDSSTGSTGSGSTGSSSSGADEADDSAKPFVEFVEDVQKYLAQNIDYGVTEDMDDAEKATQRATNIADAFQEAIDNEAFTAKWSAAKIRQIVRDINTVDDYSNSLDKLNSEYEAMSKSKRTQMQMAYDEYLQMSEAFGEEAGATIEAYERYQDALDEVTQVEEDHASTLDTIYETINSGMTTMIENLSTIMSQVEGLDTLWKALNPDADDDASYEHNINTLSRKLSTQYETVSNYRSIYDNAVQVYGENSDQARKAFNDLTSAVATYLGYSKELDELLNGDEAIRQETNNNAILKMGEYFQTLNDRYLERATAAARKAGVTLDEYLADYAEFQNGVERAAYMAGMSVDEFRAAVLESFGYSTGPRSLADIIGESSANSIDGMTEAITNLGWSLYNGAYDAGSIASQELASGLADGLTTSTPSVTNAENAAVNAAQTVSEASVDQLTTDENKESWKEAGVTLITYFADGIESGLDRIYDDIDAVIAHMNSLTSGSGGTSAMMNTVESIGNVYSYLDEYTPGVSSVLGSGIQNGISGSGAGFSLSSSVDAAREVAEATKEMSEAMTSSSTSMVGGTTNNYTFNQSNYSPTALSRIDIYRQTKNQFSALKGLST